MRILIESIQDVEKYLREGALEELVNEFGTDLSDKEAAEFVVNRVKEDFDEDISTEDVVICKVIGNDVDIISQNHPVIVYNGYYYDYGAQEFNDLFSDLITAAFLPVIQKVIKSDDQISDRLSSVKSYVMLGY